MIYLDNAAGSWPKPDTVPPAMANALIEYGANPGRGSYRMSLDTSRMVFRMRNRLAELFNCPAPERLIFTAGATESLNMAIFGLIKPNSHVIISGLEHNALWRPLAYLQDKGQIELTIIRPEQGGIIQSKQIAQAIKPNTALIAVIHASNVIGSVSPIADIGLIAKQHQIPFLVDAAQSAGLLDIDIIKMNISLLAFAGHKCLYGPPGIGGLYVAEDCYLKPIIFGGTGSLSEKWKQPEFYPDHLEVGSINTCGIAGLKAGLDFIESRGREQIYQQTMALNKAFIEKASDISGLNLYLPKTKQTVPVTALNVKNIDSFDASFMLDNDFDIAVRCGLHCAPLAHQMLDTAVSGTLRFSFGAFNTILDVDKAIMALAAIAKRGRY